MRQGGACTLGSRHWLACRSHERGTTAAKRPRVGDDVGVARTVHLKLGPQFLYELFPHPVFGREHEVANGQKLTRDHEARLVNDNERVVLLSLEEGRTRYRLR